LLRQGGVTRRPGTRFIREVKDSTKDTILLPVETSVDDAFILEMGNLYDRVYKNKAYLGVEVASPYLEAKLRGSSLHAIGRCHVALPPARATAEDCAHHRRKLDYAAVVYDPPPSFPDDTDVFRRNHHNQRLVQPQAPMSSSLRAPQFSLKVTLGV